MKVLVFLKGNEPVTTSLKVAEVFGKQHKHIIDSVRKLSAEISANLPIDGYEPKFIERNYIDSWNRQQPYFEMNRDAFTELVGNMNTAKAREWKRKYHAAFNKMEKALERGTADWQSIRQIAVTNTKKLHKVIQEVLIPIARANGSKTKDDIFHQHYEKLINKAVKIPANQRPNLSYGLQADIARLDEVIGASIIKQAQAGATHKEIYSGTKDTVEAYSEVALFGDRIELAQIPAPPKVIKSATIQLSLF